MNNVSREFAQKILKIENYQISEISPQIPSFWLTKESKRCSRNIKWRSLASGEGRIALLNNKPRMPTAAKKIAFFFGAVLWCPQLRSVEKRQCLQRPFPSPSLPRMFYIFIPFDKFHTGRSRPSVHLSVHPSIPLPVCLSPPVFVLQIWTNLEGSFCRSARSCNFNPIPKYSAPLPKLCMLEISQGYSTVPHISRTYYLLYYIGWWKICIQNQYFHVQRLIFLTWRR